MSTSSKVLDISWKLSSRKISNSSVNFLRKYLSFSPTHISPRLCWKDLFSFHSWIFFIFLNLNCLKITGRSTRFNKLPVFPLTSSWKENRKKRFHFLWKQFTEIANGLCSSFHQPRIFIKLFTNNEDGVTNVYWLGITSSFIIRNKLS